MTSQNLVVLLEDLAYWASGARSDPESERERDALVAAAKDQAARLRIEHLDPQRTDVVADLLTALEEVDSVIDKMLHEDGWPPERLAPRLQRLSTIARAAIAKGEGGEVKKGTHRRYKIAALTEHHWCPACQCQADPGQQVPALMLQNQSLVEQLVKCKKQLAAARSGDA